MAKGFTMPPTQNDELLFGSGGLYDKPPIRGRDALMGAGRDARDNYFEKSEKSQAFEDVLWWAKRKKFIPVELLIKVGIDPNDPVAIKKLLGSDEWVKVGGYTDYSRERGGLLEYRPKAKIKTKLGEPDLPTSAIGGGTITGSGPRGALFGTGIQRALAESESRRAATQEATILGAQARLRGMGAQTETTTAPGLSESGRRLEEMKARTAAEREQVAMYGKGTRTGRTKAERNFAKWREENPAAALEFERRMTQEERLGRTAQTKEEKAARAVELRKQLSDAIKSGEYPPEVIAQLRELKSESYKEGTDVETIFIEAQALFDVATTKRSQELQDQLDKEQRAADEWDRRRGRIEQFQQESAQVSRDAQAAAAELSAGRLDQRQIDQRKFQLEGQLRNIQAEIAESEPFVDPATPEGMRWKNYVDGLKSSLSIIQGAYESFLKGGPATQQIDRAGFIAAFTEQYGRAPTESELSKARGKYWF